MALRRLAGGLVLALVVAAAHPVLAGAPGTVEFDPATKQLLLQYLNDPEHNRRAVLRLANGGIDGLPTLILIVLGDAQLRSGRSGAARQLFDAALAQNPGPPAEGATLIALGWTALARGDLASARDYFSSAPAGGGDPIVAAVMTSVIDAASGDPGAAVQRVERLLADPTTPPGLVPTLQLVDGYARYWAGDLPGANAAFRDAAAANPASPAAADALYGTALTRSRLGDHAGAQAALDELAATDGAGLRRRPSANGLVDLDPRALLRSAFRRYRHGALSTAFDVQTLMTGSGHTLLRASARRGGRRHARTSLVASSDLAGDGAVSARAGDPAAATGTPGAHGGTGNRDVARTAEGASGGGWLRVVLGVAVLLLGGALLFRRRRAA